MTDKALLDYLVGVHSKFNFAQYDYLDRYGEMMFNLFTVHGLPPDIFLKNIASSDFRREDLTLDEMVYIVTVYQTLALEHRRKSGLNESRLKTIQRQYKDELKHLIEHGELGVY